MSLLVEKKERRSKSKLLKEAEEDKGVYASYLHRKAMEAEANGEFMFTIASFLRKMKVKETESDIILATDGEYIYVGKKYPLAKEKFGTKTTMFMWMHEVMHVLHAHPERMKLVGDPELYNIISDLYINEELARKGFPLPDAFIRLSNILMTLGRNNKEIYEMAKGVIKDEYTIEEVYAVLEKDQEAKDSIKRMFEKSSFFGKDLPNRQNGDFDRRQGGRSGGGSTEKKGIERNNEVGDLEEKIDNLRKTIREILGEVKRIEGTYKSIKYELMKKEGKDKTSIVISAGREGGIYGLLEYKELKKMSIKLEELLLIDVGRVVKEYTVNYSRYNHDAYWLPEEVEQYNPRIKVFVDVSSSIPNTTKMLFMNWVYKAKRKYKLEGDIISFSVGVVDKQPLSKKPKYVYLGGGTTFDESIAKEFRDARKTDIPVVFILSDFLINISEEAKKEIELYKRKGKISCWGFKKKYMPSFCDYKHELPRILKAL